MSAISLAAREAAFAKLKAHGARLAGAQLVDLFTKDAARAPALTISAPHLTLDFSKQRLDKDALTAIAELAEAAGFDSERKRLLSGEKVNVTEGRAALHTALRSPTPPPEVAETRARMAQFARTASGFDTIVHLGVGGSELGPRLIYDALKAERRPGVSVRFAANIDGADMADALEGLDPARTMVIACSKTFTTLETRVNGDEARAWLGAHASKNLVAVTAAPKLAAEWGVAEERIFPFWDWVGGRYSLWSAVGIALEVALRPGTFGRLLAGAAEMDAHFASAPFLENLPALSAAVQFWNREVLGHGSYALVPYIHRLRLTPAFLQQLEMESNGKSVDRDGRKLMRPSAMVTWGEPGTSAQHSFFQMLHQGVDAIPVEFVLTASDTQTKERRASVLANAIGQARVLMTGRGLDETRAILLASGFSAEEAERLAPHQTFPGNRASSIVALDALTPEALGALIASYEHRTFTQGVLSGINSFDQYGVELAKQMARALTPALEGAAAPDDLDGSTAAWVKRLSSR